MAYKRSIKRYRNWYAKLLRFYPKAYRERFGEGMEQTFSDLCRERMETGRGLLAFAIWIFMETSIGIIRENLTSMSMQNLTKRLIVWAVAISLLLMIPLAAMQFTEEVNWDLFDFLVMGGLLFGVGLAYELVGRRIEKTAYRAAFGVGLVTAFLLAWVNGAVGIIGNEGNPANLMYGGVILIGVIGALFARLRSPGMVRALFAMAFAQMLVPIVALFIWPPQVASWGAAGVFGVFILNAFFAALFVISALLFQRASTAASK